MSNRIEYGLLRHENVKPDASAGELFEVYMSLNLAYWRTIMESWSKEWPV